MASHYHEKGIPYSIEFCRRPTPPTPPTSTHIPAPTKMCAHTRTRVKTLPEESYPHIDACLCWICIWMTTFVGKFKGPWRFCTLCSELGRPVGTKSHICKAVQASIITKGIWFDSVAAGHIHWLWPFKLSWLLRWLFFFWTQKKSRLKIPVSRQ